MRYVVAMLFAIVVALFTTVFVSSPVASWVVSTQAFESPDEVSNLHDACTLRQIPDRVKLGFPPRG